MAVTLTTDALAARMAIFGDVNTEDRTDVLAALLAVAAATVDKYAPDAPEVVANESALRFAVWLSELPSAAPVEQVDAIRQAVNGNSFRLGFYRSGAMDLLSPWRAVSIAPMQLEGAM